MTLLSRPPSRPGLGLALAGVGVGVCVGVWLLGGVSFAGKALATASGAVVVAAGVSFLLPPPKRGWLRRRTSLVAIVPALLLFSLVLLGAALVFAARLEQATPSRGWSGAALFLLLSALLVSALFRELVLRHDVSLARRADDPSSRWQFTSRWKDELVCASPEGELVLGMAMDHVSFPPEEVWARRMPEWAKARRAELLSALEAWCAAYGVVITIDERQWTTMTTRDEW